MKINLALLLILLAGCSTGPTPEQTETQKQDAALNDPMNYKQSVGHDITGGDITHFDHSGFNRDLNDALNP